MIPRQTSAVLVGALIVAALVAAYFGFRSRPSTDAVSTAASASRAPDRSSEPAPSVAQQAASPAPDAVAAKNADVEFQAQRLCMNASRELAMTKVLSDCKQYEGQPRFQEIYAQCLNGWMNVPNRKVAAEAALKDAGCADTTDVEASYFEATKQAARAGIADAQMCYLEGDFGSAREVSLFTKEDRQEYQRVAPRYIDAALRRGDWRIVQLMTKDSFEPGTGPVRGLPGIGKPETVYKMRKLLRLGASGSYAEILDADLNGMIHPDLVPEAALPADVVQRGDAWAQQTFNEFFAGVPGLTERPTVCVEPLGKIDRLPGPTTQNR